MNNAPSRYIENIDLGNAYNHVQCYISADICLVGWCTYTEMICFRIMVFILYPQWYTYCYLTVVSSCMLYVSFDNYVNVENIMNQRKQQARVVFDNIRKDNLYMNCVNMTCD